MKDLYEVKAELSSMLEPRTRAEVELPLEQSLYMTLSQDVYANYDSPLFSNSAMDGYALGSLGDASFKVIGAVFAGDIDNLPMLHATEAVRIFTGAKIPTGTRAVVMQEYCQEQDGVLTFDKTVRELDNIRLQGEEFKKGSLLIKAGTLLKAAHIALLASQNVSKVKVQAPLRVGVLSSGSELKALGEALTEGQIIDSNRLMLISLLKEFQGIEIVDLGIVKDDYPLVKEVLTQACDKLDVLLISGGASVGEADFAVKAVQELGSLQVHKVAIKPGKPFGIGKIEHTTVFIMPGNPVSAFVTYHLLTRFALAQLLNINLSAKTMSVVADFDYTSLNKRRQFLRVKLNEDNQGMSAQYIAEQGSGMLSGCTQADALLEVAPMTEIKRGQVVKVFVL